MSEFKELLGIISIMAVAISASFVFICLGIDLIKRMRDKSHGGQQ